MNDIVSQLIGLIRAVALTRLLAPADFGLFGIALLIQRWIDAFSETGVTAALVQKSGDVEPYFGTALWLQFGRAAVVCLSVLIFAPWAGVFFHNADAPAMIRCLALSTVCWSFTNPAVVQLRRDLQFRTDVLWRLSNVVTSFVVALGACLILRNAWGLVIGLVAGQFAQSASSYLVCRTRFRCLPNWTYARELLRFGRYISATNMLNFLDSQIDSLATGRFLGTTALGYYQVAIQFTNPATRVGTLLNGLLFPAFCKVEHQESRTVAFLRVLSPVATVMVPAGFLFGAIGQYAVTAILGDKWAASASLTCILVWAAIPRALTACSTSLLLSEARTKLLFLCQCVKIALMLVLLYILLPRYAVTGVAIAASVSAMVGLVQQLVVVCRASGVSLTAALSSFRLAALVSAPGAAALLLSLWHHQTLSAILLVIAAACYGVTVWRTSAQIMRRSRAASEPLTLRGLVSTR